MKIIILLSENSAYFTLNKLDYILPNRSASHDAGNRGYHLDRIIREMLKVETISKNTLIKESSAWGYSS